VAGQASANDRAVAVSCTDQSAGTWTVAVTFSSIEVKADRPVTVSLESETTTLTRGPNGTVTLSRNFGADQPAATLTWLISRLDYQNTGVLHLDRPAGCGETTPSTEAPPTTPATEAAPTTPSTEAAPTVPATVLAETVTPAPSALPETGRSTLPLVGLGAGAVIGGLAWWRHPPPYREGVADEPKLWWEHADRAAPCRPVLRVRARYVHRRRPFPRGQWEVRPMHLRVEVTPEVHVRPIRPSDAEAFRRFHGGLSAQSLYYRFFSPKPRLTGAEVERFTTVDMADRVALVATLGDELIADARYDRWAGKDEAEVAFTVADEHQGRGLSTILLEHLAAIARTHGIARFTAEVLGRTGDALRVRPGGMAGQPGLRQWRGRRRVRHRAHPDYLNTVDRREQRAESLDRPAAQPRTWPSSAPPTSRPPSAACSCRTC
jgi:GNAT superfamily N-acetyltransferase